LISAKRVPKTRAVNGQAVAASVQASQVTVFSQKKILN